MPRTSDYRTAETPEIRHYCYAIETNTLSRIPKVRRAKRIYAKSVDMAMEEIVVGIFKNSVDMEYLNQDRTVGKIGEIIFAVLDRPLAHLLPEKGKAKADKKVKGLNIDSFTYNGDWFVEQDHIANLV
jgi:hypothetical protein